MAPRVSKLHELLDDASTLAYRQKRGLPERGTPRAPRVRPPPAQSTPPLPTGKPRAAGASPDAVAEGPPCSQLPIPLSLPRPPLTPSPPPPHTQQSSPNIGQSCPLPTSARAAPPPPSAPSPAHPVESAHIHRAKLIQTPLRPGDTMHECQTAGASDGQWPGQQPFSHQTLLTDRVSEEGVSECGRDARAPSAASRLHSPEVPSAAKSIEMLADLLFPAGADELVRTRTHPRPTPTPTRTPTPTPDTAPRHRTRT